MHELLVIVVTFNAMPWIDKCLNSVLTSSINADLFIIDNGSQDGTIEHIKTQYPQVLFKQSSANLGFGKANNIGLQYAIEKDYAYIYLLNQDAWVEHDTFKSLIEEARNNPEYGILSPLQVQANRKKLDENFVTGVLSYESCPSILSDALIGSLQNLYSVKDVMAAHWLITRECLLRIGGFSPSFPHYGEDINYAERVTFHGMKIGIVLNAIGIHDREKRTTTWQKKIYIDYIRAIKILSSPFNIPYYKRISYSLNIIFKDIIKYKTLHPLKYFLRILSDTKDIAHYRNISIKNKTAFLKNAQNN